MSRSLAERVRGRLWKIAGIHLANGRRLSLGDFLGYTLRYLAVTLFGRRSQGWLQPPGIAFPVCARFGTSDLDVFYQIFVEQEYAVIGDASDVRVVLDMGANVGYSSAWFASTFPDARIIAVEPDPENAAMCRINLAPYGDRVTVLQVGAWSRRAGLVLRRDFRDGREWSVQVREALPNEQPEVEAVDIATILAEAGVNRIDILKMDTERAEIEIFGNNPQPWLQRTRNLVVELHDEECERVCFSALSRYAYELRHSGELTIARDLRVSPSVGTGPTVAAAERAHA